MKFAFPEKGEFYLFYYNANLKNRVLKLWQDQHAEISLTKSPNPMLFTISRQTFPKIQGQLMPMTGVISGVIIPTDKTKSNLLAIIKVGIFPKSLVSF